MFVGFIAVIVIILIIVTLMSTGATSGSGGVDQTKATKAVGEISALGQAIGFYKTTSATNNYAGINVANLVTAGIVNSTDLANSTATMSELVVTNGVPASAATASGTGTNNLIASKAVKGLYYDVVQGKSASEFVVKVLVDINDTNGLSTADTGLFSALETSYAKLVGSGSIATATGTVSTDGIAAITLK